VRLSCSRQINRILTSTYCIIKLRCDKVNSSIASVSCNRAMFWRGSKHRDRFQVIAGVLIGCICQWQRSLVLIRLFPCDGLTHIQGSFQIVWALLNILNTHVYKSFSLESLLLDTLSMMQWFAVCFSILQCHNCYVVFTLVNSQATLFDSMFQFKVAMFFSVLQPGVSQNCTLLLLGWWSWWWLWINAHGGKM